MEVGAVQSLNPFMHGHQPGQGAERASEKPQQAAGTEELSQQEKQRVAELQKTDRQVKAHEAAHVAAGSGLVKGGASFQYTQGPDGKRYAVGGEVSIDSSPVAGDPEATIRKAEQIRRAALAPADPSAQDRRVAAQATQMAAEARIELASERRESSEEGEQPNQVQAAGLDNYRAIQDDSETQDNSINLIA